MRNGESSQPRSTSRIRVQTWGRSGMAMDALAELIGTPWPHTLGDTATARHRVLCIGTTEWLVTMENESEEASWAILQKAAARCEATAVDVSQGLICRSLEGPHARDILSKGCGLDLHPRAFGPDRCARTRLAQIGAILDCRSASRFDCYVARSYDDYLARWLEDAAIEFGMRS
jgi:sarcosine oxidase subunit gamma